MIEGEVMIVSTEDIIVLKNYIPNIEELIREGDVQKVLDAIDDEIIKNMYRNKIEPYEPDEEGVRLQFIYDRIYADN